MLPTSATGTSFAMILMAYLFGWLLGHRPAPTATYIIGAVIMCPAG